MRLLSLSRDGRATIAVRKDDGIYDLRIAAPDLPTGLDLLMSSGTDWLARTHTAAAQVTEAARLSETEITYRPVLERPGKLICVGAITRHMLAKAAQNLWRIPTSSPAATRRL